MPFYPHILSPISTPWVAWWMLLLLACAAWAELAQRGTLSIAFTTIGSKAERTFQESNRNILSEILLKIFRIGTLALLLYLYAYTTGNFLFTTYLLIALVVLLIDILKFTMAKWIDYTFQLTQKVNNLHSHYNHIWTVICSMMYLVLLLCLNTNSTMLIHLLMMILFGLAVILITTKLIRIFFSGIRSVIYIFIYVATLEVIPLGILLLSVKYIV